MKKTKILSQDDCDSIIEKALFLIDKGIDQLSKKDTSSDQDRSKMLSSEDLKNLVLMLNCVQDVKKNRLAELKQMKQEVSSLTKSELLALTKIEAA